MIGYFYVVDCSADFVPASFQFDQSFSTFSGEEIILARRTLSRFDPFIVQDAILLEACEQRIECAFDDYQSRISEVADYL